MNQYEFYVSDANETGMRDVVVADTYGHILSRFNSIIFLPQDVLVPGRQELIRYTEVSNEMVGYRADTYPDIPLESYVQTLDPLELVTYIEQDIARKEEINNLTAKIIESSINSI